MIKTSTILKRMVVDLWKPVAKIAGLVAALFLIVGAAQLLGYDGNTVYWNLLLIWFLRALVKIAYDITRDRIKIEQEQLMKDLGKTND